MPVAGVAAAGTGLVVAMWSGRVVLGIAVVAPMAVCATAVQVLVASRGQMANTEAMARFTGALANQVSAADTVIDALAQAAVPVSGPVGTAATLLVNDAEEIGLEEAARRFAQRVDAAPASWLADIITVADDSGSGWAGPMKALEAEVNEAAVTARRFHSQVAALMPSLVVVVMLAAVIVAGVGWASADAGRWLLDGTGAAVLVVTSGLAAGWCAGALLPARNFARSR